MAAPALQPQDADQVDYPNPQTIADTVMRLAPAPRPMMNLNCLHCAASSLDQCR
jgi:hypothetical protein